MRCESCDLRWERPARFCGRCGAALGTAAAPSGSPREPPRRTGRIVLAAVCAVAVAVLGSAGSATVDALRTDLSDDTIAIPNADRTHVTTVIRSTDRDVRPADCGDHLQDLPRPIRRYSMHKGTLEWRDGRLCALLPPGAQREARPACDPPMLLACVVP